MTRTKTPRGLIFAVLFLMSGFISLSLLVADEGMWTFDNPPFKLLKEKYGFVPDAKWLEHVRLASVRVNDGGSASFISANGLVLTNHHVARGQIQKLSNADKDYVRDGFYAPTLADELPCPDVELNVLVSIENVTSEVLKAVKPGMSLPKALAAKKSVIAGIEKKSQKKTGLTSQVVGLYSGGEYWLYRYKKYTEVKLVFAPEQQISFFGGDPDNFTFPRHDIDMTIYRAYEKGKPANTPNYFPVSSLGAQDGELVFVSGHPGSTNRMMTEVQLEYQRDISYPIRLKSYIRRLQDARNYSSLGQEQARQAANMIFGIENSLKVSQGEFKGLNNPKIMAKKIEEEKAFRQLIEADPKYKQLYGDAWDMIAKAYEKLKSRQKEISYRRLPGVRLLNTALSIVRYADEIKKPDGERLDGYHDAELDSFKYYLMSPAPYYPDFEKAMIKASLEQTSEELGADDIFVKTFLNGKAIDEVIADLLNNTKLTDPKERKRLLDGGSKAVAESNDACIVMVRRLDPILRELRKWQEDNVDSLLSPAGEKIGQAHFAVYGKSSFPDATFTLRLAPGIVKGYPMNGTVAPSKTTFHGLYDRFYSFDQKPPFDLPKKFIDAKDKIDLATPLNFVSTCDIIGGNSGSPVVNRQGELVGLIFDGNIESLIGRFIYDEEASRAVAVHSAAIVEMLKKVYQCDRLVEEILSPGK